MKPFAELSKGAQMHLYKIKDKRVPEGWHPPVKTPPPLKPFHELSTHQQRTLIKLRSPRVPLDWNDYKPRLPRIKALSNLSYENLLERYLVGAPVPASFKPRKERWQPDKPSFIVVELRPNIDPNLQLQACRSAWKRSHLEPQRIRFMLNGQILLEIPYDARAQSQDFCLAARALE